jgi:dolichol-phosphate mannosyltransferase
MKILGRNGSKKKLGGTNMLNYSNEARKLSEESGSRSPTVGVLTACLNESGNIRVWLGDIFSVYQKFNLTMIKEIVIVDDGSTDGTIKQIEDIIEIYPIPIRLIRRNSRMGTLNAQIIGSRQSSTDYVLVMDCDLQHPPSLIPEFIREIKEDIDIVVGSRYTIGGFNKWPAFRGVVSRAATFLAYCLIKNSRKLTDPLSGYFLIRKEILSGLNPYRMMYKPLLYAISMNKGARMKEIPVRMDSRESGESKIVNGPIRVIIRYIREILIFFRDSHHNLNGYQAIESGKSDMKTNLSYERRK